MTLDEINSLPVDEARAALERCCGSARWVDQMLARRPFANRAELFRAAEEADQALTDADWREAFSHHPRIGDVAALRTKFASTATWAAGEQSGAAVANDETLQALAAGNDAYFEKFGFIFIVCATGKTADEMLALLRARLPNPPGEEIAVAAAEQAKITRLRLEKLLS